MKSLLGFGIAGFRSMLPPRGAVLFSKAWYEKQFPGVVENDKLSLSHYLETGWRVGATPHPLFDGSWYLKRNPDVAQENINPLLHYLDYGWREGRSPHPLFDVERYRKDNPGRVPLNRDPLLHFLKTGGKKGFSPHPLFDSAWYLSEYPDVAESKANPLAHYLEFGWLEDRSPHPLFDTKYYLKSNPDVERSRMNPLLHYLSSGADEMRAPHPLFDMTWYRDRCGDADLGGLDPLTHFLEIGWKEGLSPHPFFDVGYYLQQNPDVAAAGINPLTHFVRLGWRERRAPCAVFDTKWYLQRNNDVVESGINPLVHFVQTGWQERRHPHPLFDLSFYLKQYPDVEYANLNPLRHFLTTGWRESRRPHPLFDTKYYVESYPEATVNGDPLSHYIAVGAYSGFNPNAFFDSQFYIDNHETLYASRENPLVHFAAIGADEGRDPHPCFSLEYYLANNPDIADRGINPLAHFLLTGKAEGRQPHPPSHDSEACAVLDIPYEILKAPGEMEGRDVCLFVTYSADGRVLAHVLDYFGAIRAQGWDVVVIVATEGLAYSLPPEFLSAEGLIVRKNHGWDFAAWATALAAVPDLWRARLLLFTNDSIYGPVDPRAFEKTVATVRNSSADIVALTDSYQVQRHFMSFFWMLRAPALASDAVRRFFASVESVKDKHDVVHRYELNAFKTFSEAGLSVEIVFPAENDDSLKAVNPTLHLWRELLDRGFPFIKVQALRDDIAGVDKSNWWERVSDNARLLANIATHLELVSKKARVKRAAFPAPKRQFVTPRRLKTFYGATSATRIRENSDLAIETPFEFVSENPAAARKIAVVAHIFYPEMAAEICEELERISVPVDIFISTNSRDKQAAIEAAFSRFPRGRVVVKVFDNIGRDIAPMLVGFRSVFFDYDILLHLHSKKSPHGDQFTDWRRFMVQNLLGSPETVRSILEILGQPDVGVVFSDHFPPVRKLLNWGYNFENCQSLLKRLGVDLTMDLPLEFPSGSFFWAKTDALRPLVAQEFDWSDFPFEAGQIDGTLAHAIERSLLFVCEAAGYRWTKVSVRGNTPGERLVPVPSAEFLPRALLQTHRRLLGNPVRPAVVHRALPEVQPLATRKDASSRPRLNLLSPTLHPSKIFGGVSTALRMFRELSEALGDGFDLRIIVTSDKVGVESSLPFPGYVVTGLGSSFDDLEKTIVNAGQADGAGEIGVRENDFFIATAWWTAIWGGRIADAQMAYFGRKAPSIYLIQDFEPGFYGWNAQYGSSVSTYFDPENTIALINSEELAAFVQPRFQFRRAYVIPYSPNETVVKALRPAPRERIILFYGRPSVSRNCFEVIRSALALWQRANPIAADRWRIISVGESYEMRMTHGVENIEVVGKLSLRDYGEMLSKASVGISLMLSPHPSYPPLEMAQAGLLTITNDFECKDLSMRSDSVRRLHRVTPEALAEILASTVQEAEAGIGKVSQTGAIRSLDSELPVYDPKVLARHLRQFVGSEATALEERV